MNAPESRQTSRISSLTCQVRFGIIDYLRQWKFVEVVEHLKKSLVSSLAQQDGGELPHQLAHSRSVPSEMQVRDVIAGERNHAVVPVQSYAEHFSRFFADGMFSSANHSGIRTLLDRLVDRFLSVLTINA